MKDIKIRTKLVVYGIVMIVVLLLMGIVSVFLINKINNDIKTISGNWLPSIINIEEVDVMVSNYRIEEYKMIIETEKEKLDELQRDMRSRRSDIEDVFGVYEELITNNEDAALVNDVKSKWTEYIAISKEAEELSFQNMNDEARDLMYGKSLEVYEDLSDIIVKIIDFNKRGSDQSVIEADRSYRFATIFTISFGVGVLILVLTLTIYITKAIMEPVREMDEVADKIANGQLNENITYESKNELGMLAANFNKTVVRLRDYVKYIEEISMVLDQIAQGDLVFELQYDYFGEFAKVKNALNNISDTLCETMKNISESASQVTSGSEQLAGGAQTLAEGATEQAGAIEELLATMGEVTQQVRDNARDAEKASNETQKAVTKTEESKSQMDHMATAMKNISDTSQKVVSIIQTIEEIASQTNLLALNASIEAARAGEAGRGFAVVANEIGALADDSSQAAMNTRDLIQLSIEEISRGDEVVQRVVTSLDQVIESVTQVAALVDATKVGSAHQAEAAEQINAGIEQMTSVVQSNSAAAEESSATSEELAAQAQNLNEMISRFKIK